MGIKRIKTKDINDKAINILAIVSFGLIVLYENCIVLYKNAPCTILLKLRFVLPIIRIIIQLSYAYIGSYIFYKLLCKRDENYNKIKAKKDLIPRLESCIGAYKEFIEGFPNFSSQNKPWNELGKKEFKNLMGDIKFKDKYQHRYYKYYFTKKEECFNTYLKYIENLLKNILKQLEEVKRESSILDDRITENICMMVKRINMANKVIDIYIDSDQEGVLKSIEGPLFEFHESIKILDNTIQSIYDK